MSSISTRGLVVLECCSSTKFRNEENDLLPPTNMAVFEPTSIAASDFVQSSSGGVTKCPFSPATS